MDPMEIMMEMPSDVSDWKEDKKERLILLY